MAQQLKIAHLDETAVAKVRALEEETGKHIMAFESGPPFAELSAELLQKVQLLENELGVVLFGLRGLENPQLIGFSHEPSRTAAHT